MKRYSWFTDGVRDADNGKYVLYEDHRKVVKEAQGIIETFLADCNPSFLKGEYQSDDESDNELRKRVLKWLGKTYTF